MGWSRRVTWCCLSLLVLMGLVSCKISYSFSGGTIDYSQVKSISIKDFPNNAPLVYPPLSQKFTDALTDKYVRQTRLQLLKKGGTLDLEGEIVGYDYTPQAVKEDAYSSMTRLTVTVRVRYTNEVTPDEDFEQSFSAYREFSNTRTIEQVQDELSDDIIKELVDLIYNATVANW